MGDTHLQATNAALLIYQRLLQVLIKRHHALSILNDQFTICRRLNLAAAAHKQRDIQFLFYLLNVLADRRLS